MASHNIDNFNATNENAEETLNIKELLNLCLAKWYWFVISIFICMGLAVIYILRTIPIYTRETAVLIKENSSSKKGGAKNVSDFTDFDLFKTSTNVDNEIETMQSPDLMREVVERLNINTTYYVDGAFHDKILYGETLPVQVQIFGVPDDKTVSFELNIKKGTFTASDFELGDESFNKKINLTPGSIVATPIGKIQVTTTEYFDAAEDMEIRVVRRDVKIAADAYLKRLTATQNNEKSSIINLSFKDYSPQRAEDVLAAIITIYNEKWVQDKNLIATSTSEFINERLKVIESELGDVDKNISSFKSSNLLPDVEKASNMYMQQAAEANAKILELNNQLHMAKYVRSYLANTSNRFNPLPVNSGFENGALSSQINNYNEELVQRNNLVSNSSVHNPLVKNADAALADLRQSILSSIDNQIVSLNEQIRSQEHYESTAISRISSNPKQANYLLSVERQQKVKESLYLYLLQKREENELSQAFTAYNTRIITQPTGSKLPTSPVKRNILLVAFAIGLLLPVGIIFLRENFNTKIRGRKDLENISVPFIGEVPYKGVKKSRIPYLNKRKKKGAAGELKKVVVKRGSRDIMNEAIRVVRTNLDFVMNKDPKENVTVITSFNPGSGKSFISINLGAALSIKDKKVLIVDCDLRHGSASQYVGSPKHGLSDYLSGRDNNAKSLIVQFPDYPNLWIMPIGTIPPNPTELLEDGRFQKFIDEVRGDYDYVLLDCPPVDIVADTQIIARVSDRTIFIVRAGLLERSMLSELQAYYDEKKYRNMYVILNGTESISNGRYGYKYGYKYGYNYGYYGGKKGHGYYSSEEDDKD